MTRSLSFGLGVLLALGVAIAIPSLAVAQSPEYNRQLNVQLDAVAKEFGGIGQRIVRGPLGGSLEVGGCVTYSFMFRAGQSYSIVGVCDKDCSDLDITLYDPTGELITVDAAADSIPIVSHRAEKSGRYRAIIRMPTCTTGNCYYAVAAYSDRGGPNSARPKPR
jgi:hypothetical protein